MTDLFATLPPTPPDALTAARLRLRRAEQDVVDGNNDESELLAAQAAMIAAEEDALERIRK